MTASCTVRLPIFEGPLDLLLHLIKRNEVQITDIPIATITDQYLALLDELPELNLDAGGEYLVMAATLVYIKSRMLLPTGAEQDEPEEDPRAELMQRLVEYQRFREVAVSLGERSLLARDVFAGRGESAEPAPEGEESPPPVRDASFADLLDALRDVLKRVRKPAPHEIEGEGRSVRECVGLILAHFELTDRVEFQNVFAPDAPRSDVIVTFLAVLELIRLRVIRARQDDRFGPIMLELAVASAHEAVLRARELGYDEWGGGEDDNGDGAARDR
jgi:segregation and condensation protein A